MTGLKMKRINFVVLAFAGVAITGCERPADVASYNLSMAADRFEIERRVVFFNGITDKYLMSIQGLCSIGNADKPREITVTCKTGPNEYKKHFLGLSDNVSYFAEQIDDVKVSPYYYKVVFRPQTIVPDLNMETGH